MQPQFFAINIMSTSMKQEGFEALLKCVENWNLINQKWMNVGI